MTSLEKLAREIKEKACRADYHGDVIQHGPEVDWCNGNKVRVYGSALDQRLSNIAAHIASCSPTRISALMDVVLAYEKAVARLMQHSDSHSDECASMDALNDESDCDCEIAKDYRAAREALAYAEQRLREV